MDTSTPQRSAVSPLRLAKLFGIIVGGITLLAVLAVVGLAEWPLVTATVWHLRNGNAVELEGHSFHVPPLYHPEVSNGGKQIDIMKDPRLFAGGASVTLESNPKTLDEDAINRWQAALIAAIRNHRHDPPAPTPLTVRGKKLTFLCVDIGVGGESLVCHAVGTNLTVGTWASPAHVQETRTILETSE